MAYVSVYVDESQVLSELSTEELIEELADRRKKGSAKGAVDPDATLVLSSWEMETLASAVLAGDGHRALSVLRPIFMPPLHAPTREVFDALPRDPRTGRPMVM